MQGTSNNGVGRVAWLAGIGPDLVSYAFDVRTGQLAEISRVRLPAPVQYLWQHGDGQTLYVTASNGGPDGNGGMARATRDDLHCLCALRLTRDGDLSMHGPAVTLPQRAIHHTLDAESRHVLVVYPRPPAVSVHRIAPDGTLGEEVAQSGDFGLGVYLHQIRAMPSGRTVIVVARGHHHNDRVGRPNEPGELQLFDYHDGVLTPRSRVAPDGGTGFGPRHIDFHPDGRWLLASLEPQNALVSFALDGDMPGANPLSRVSTLRHDDPVHPFQMAGTLHVHPGGRFVYGCNRVNSEDESQVARAGEDSIVACAFDTVTGRLTVLQIIDTVGRHPRTFAIDPSGRWLLAGNKSPVVQRGGAVVPACVDVFAIGDDGRLTLAHSMALDMPHGASMFWSGLVNLPD